MSTSRNDTTVTKAAIQLNLTAAGWTVLAMIVAAVFLSASRRIAIGFLIPMAAAVAIDLFLSWQIISRRTVAITPTRSVVYRPDGIPLRVTASGPSMPLRVMVTAGVAEYTFGMAEESASIELDAAHTAVADFVRSDTSCSVFGLAFAHRWQTHLVPMMHWAPAPSLTRLATPEAVDEVAHLREYVPGDRMSRVSWATTARTGRMHVRSAGAGHEEFVVVVNLGHMHGTPGDGALATGEVPAAAAAAATERPNIALLEGTLQLAATLVSQLLEDGHQVRMVTTELRADYLDELRRSAVEDPRLDPVMPSDSFADPRVVDRYVSDEDDLARRLSLAEVGPPMGWSYGTYVDISMLGIRTLP